MMLKFLSGTIQMKYVKISAWRKQMSASYSLYGVACHKRPGEITSSINAQVFIEIPDNFLICLIENWFDGDEVIF